MRISELSDRASVPVATVEYYQRERLISHPSERHGYSPEDLRRLRLVRVLVEVGGLNPDQVRDLLGAMAGGTRTPHETFGMVLRTLEGTPSASLADVDPTEDEALVLARRVADRHGWTVDQDTASWRTLVKLLRTLHWLDDADTAVVVEAYAAAADRMTGAEIGVLGLYADEDALVERLVLWTVFGDPLLAALRRIARQHTSGTVFNREFSPADRGSAL